MTVALLVHLLAAVVWVGGMFFAHMALRPAAASTLAPPQRLALMDATLARFLPWVAAAIVALFATGIGMLALGGGIAAAGWGVHAMIGIALVMTAIYAELVLRPFRRLRAAVASQAWPDAGAAMNSIRRRVGINLVLGLATIAVAVGGRGG